MRKFVIQDRMLVPPFNEPASELMVMTQGGRTTSLALHQVDVLDVVLDSSQLEVNLNSIHDLEKELAKKRYGLSQDDEVIVYRNNLYFDREFIEYFVREARQSGRSCQAALPADDRAWRKYSLPLTSLVLEKPDSHSAGYYRLELFYFPRGWTDPSEWQVIPVPSGEKERGYYNVPDSMTNLKKDEMEGKVTERKDQDLTHFLTARSCSPIQSWVHVFNANVALGVFSRGYRFEESVSTKNFLALRLLWRAIIEQQQIVSSSTVVKVGRNCDIAPSAIILGPTTIGDNVRIGPGAFIDNCVIGDNTTIANNCHLMLSVVGQGCFLPFRAALFMTVMMDSTIVAQNTCLQMCVLGRNSFVGAGTTFTDFNLLPSRLRALDAYGEMSDIEQPVMGGCVGHNVRIGAGMLIQPARAIESDVVLISSPERRIISKYISYDMSDHHTLRSDLAARHRRLYPPRVYMGEAAMLEEW